MDKNMEWFVRANLSSYEGKYVAIAKESVVTSGRTRRYLRRGSKKISK